MWRIIGNVTNCGNRLASTIADNCRLEPPEVPSAASSLRVVVCEPSQSYWVSTEGKKLFKLLDDEQEALEAVTNQMELLSDVLSDAKS
jgi:hypothetical protein